VMAVYTREDYIGQPITTVTLLLTVRRVSSTNLFSYVFILFILRTFNCPSLIDIFCTKNLEVTVHSFY
jgi:hypothetical protein